MVNSISNNGILAAIPASEEKEEIPKQTIKDKIVEDVITQVISNDDDEPLEAGISLRILIQIGKIATKSGKIIAKGGKWAWKGIKEFTKVYIIHKIIGLVEETEEKIKEKIKEETEEKEESSDTDKPSSSDKSKEPDVPSS